jgi:hypothetical protein
MANEVERERERERAFLDRQVELDKTLKRIQEREEEYRLYRIRKKIYQKISDIIIHIVWVLLLLFHIYNAYNLYDFIQGIQGT